MIEVIDRIPIKDTALNSGMPYENYGDYYALFLGKYLNHSVYRSLLQFDLPTLLNQGMIEKVEILIYIIRNDHPEYPKEFEVYRIEENFDENAVNYANQPSIDTVIYKKFTIKDEVNTYIEVDVTNLFSEWYRGKYPNYGLLIKAKDENTNSLISFYSKDSSETPYPPKLRINFNRFIQDNMTKDVEDIENIKSNPEECYIVGNQLFEVGSYSKAYRYYKKSLDNFIPTAKYSPKLLLRMVLTLENLGKYDEGLEMIELGLSHYPNFTDLVFLKGSIFSKQHRISLAINEIKKCLDMGESPLHLSFIFGVESFRSYHALSQIYYEIQDYPQAYTYCIKALHTNPKFMDSLHILVKILEEKQRDINDIKLKLESFLGTDLDGKDYLTLADIFFKQRKYAIAYEYLLRAEESLKSLPKIFYHKGMCQLYLKNYKDAYEILGRIKEGEFYERAIYRMALCEILNYNMNHAATLLNILRDPENNGRRIVYNNFKSLIEGKEAKPISDDKKESEEFLDIIFELLDILIIAASPEIFEKSLQLLNNIENDEVLLRLAKLYYHHGFYKLAYQDFVRSIKIFDHMDLEGLDMMTKSFSK